MGHILSCCQELSPNFADPWNGKGWILNNLKRYDEAIKCYDKAIELSPNFADPWNGKGAVHHRLGKYNDAIQYYEKAIELEPNNGGAWYNRACSNIKKGQVENGLIYLKKAIEIDKEYYIELAKKDEDFLSIKNDERFKALDRLT